MTYVFKKSLIALLWFLVLSFKVNAASFDLTGSFAILPDMPEGTVITGALDTDAKTIVINTFDFQGKPLSTVSGEVLSSGYHYRTASDGRTRWARIENGNVGAYFVMSWSGAELGFFVEWQHDSLSNVYTNVANRGNDIRGSNLAGKEVSINFTAIEQGVFVRSTLVVNNGTIQECTQTGGTMVDFSASAEMNLYASLAAMDWSLDGVPVGDGSSNINVFASLGTHVIEVTVVTDQGATDTSTASFEIVDTTNPSVQIAFIDSSGQEVTSAANGDVSVQMTATDICDSAPVIINGGAIPIMSIVDGDVIHIVQQDNNVILPTTAVSVGAVALDSSGNASSRKSATLNIE